MFRSIALAFFLFCFTTIAVPPPNDNFANAITLPTGPVLVTGTTVGATRQAGEPTMVDSGYGYFPPQYLPLGTNSVWWKWTSPSNYVVRFSTCLANESSETDTQLGVYTGSNVSALTEIASNDERPPRGHGGSEVLVPVNQGITYYILVAGFEGDAGSVKLYRTDDVTQMKLNISIQPDYIIVSGIVECRGLFSLQSSTNLTEWSLVEDFHADGVQVFGRFAETNSPAKFYRTVIH